MRGLMVLFVVTLVIVALLPIPLAHAFHEGPPEFVHWTSWQAPEDFTGDLVLQTGLDFGTDNLCIFVVVLAGDAEDLGLHYAYVHDSGEWSVSGSGTSASAHTDTVDTREIIDSGNGAWGVWSTHWGPRSGEGTFTVAGFDLAKYPGDGSLFGPSPAKLEVGCTAPFDVTSRAGSTQVIGFSIDTLDGGTGASANTLVGPEVNVNLDDVVAGSFDTERVATHIVAYPVLGASVGHGTLSHPGGEQRHAFGIGPTRIAHTGPGGDHAFTVERASVSDLDLFWGVMAGLDGVAHFDEIVA